MKRFNNSLYADDIIYKRQKTEKRELNIEQKSENLEKKFLSLKSKLQKDGVNYDEFQSSFVTSIARRIYANTFIDSLLKENYLVLKNIITLCKKSENLSITFFSSILHGTGKESAKVIKEVASIFFKKQDENFLKDQQGNFIPSDTYNALNQVNLVKSFSSILSSTGKESAKVIKEVIDKIFVTKNSDPVVGKNGQYQLLNPHFLEFSVTQRNDSVEANDSIMLSDTGAADNYLKSLFCNAMSFQGVEFIGGHQNENEHEQ